MQNFKLGLLPITYDKRDLLLADFLDLKKLPTPPSSYGHETLITGDWGIYGNDQYGDCVPAGIAHQEMLLTKEGNNPARFDTTSVLGNYTDMTGFDPNDPSTDNGEDMRDAYKYWRKGKFIDANGVLHAIEGWAALEPGNVPLLKSSLYLFGTVGVGYDWPESAFDQFEASRPFSVVAGAQSAGMHYVPATGYAGYLRGPCWGRLCLLSEGFYKAKCRMAIVPFSKEMLVKGVSLEGFGALELSQVLARI